MYFANISQNGPVEYRDVPGSIGVLEALDNSMPIGIATEIGWTAKGLALWKLKVHGKELPGHWVIIDREFRPTKRKRPAPRG
jgi:hypothetical protein